MLYLEKKIQGTILDVGGGGEGIIGRLYQNQVVAIDNCQEELDEAPNCFTKMLMDASNLQFPAENFDNVTFFYSLMFMDTKMQSTSIKEAVRVLKKGGFLHIWDAKISSAYPEPFCIDLDICIHEEVIHTTYGIISDVKNQTYQSFISICSRLGLTIHAQQIEEDAFYLVFKKQ